MAERLDYSQVRPENKWKILRAQWRFALWALYSSIGSTMLGFDLTAGLQMIAIRPFQRQYGIPFPSAPGGYLIPARWQSGWNGAASAGPGLGCIVAIFLLNRIGRKPLITIGCIFNVVGTGLYQASHEWKLFLVGRLINGFGFGMVYTFSPVWIGELARPELRGIFLCLSNGSIVVGQFILTLVSKGASKITTDWGYKLLMVIQYVPPAILLAGVFFFPESAYFLIKKGKIEAAEKSLRRMHGSKDPELLNIELKRLTENVRFSEELKKQAAIGGPLIYQCFRGTNLKRTLTAILLLVAPQFLGSFFYVGYVTYFFELIGITQAFDITCAVISVSLVTTCVTFYSIEVVGRRTSLVPGMVAITITCLIVGICGSLPLTNRAAQWVIVIADFFWVIFEHLSIGPIGVACASEISTLPLRATVQGIMFFSQILSSWVVSFSIPYIINPDAANLGAKIGYIFFGMSVILSVLVYFYTPETKGLSFAEMDYLYSTKTDPRKFQATIKTRREEHPEGVETVVPDEKAVAYDSQA